MRPFKYKDVNDASKVRKQTPAGKERPQSSENATDEDFNLIADFFSQKQDHYKQGANPDPSDPSKPDFNTFGDLKQLLEKGESFAITFTNGHSGTLNVEEINDNDIVAFGRFSYNGSIDFGVFTINDDLTVITTVHWNKPQFMESISRLEAEAIGDEANHIGRFWFVEDMEGTQGFGANESAIVYTNTNNPDYWIYTRNWEDIKKYVDDNGFVLTPEQQAVIDANPYSNQEKEKVSKALTVHQDISGKVNVGQYDLDPDMLNPFPPIPDFNPPVPASNPNIGVDGIAKK